MDNFIFVGYNSAGCPRIALLLGLEVEKPEGQWDNHGRCYGHLPNRFGDWLHLLP